MLGSNVNYYYWLTTHLARLKNIEDAVDLSAVKMLVGSSLTQIHWDALGRLGIPSENVIACDPNTRYDCKELIVPGLLSSVDVTHRAAAEWLRDKFGPKQRDTSYPARVLLSRSKDHRRAFLNEDEIEQALAQRGFVKVTPDTLSFDEQSHILQNAETVVSPYGTCLTISMFAPLDCRIFELIDEPSRPWHRYIENIAVQLGQSFACVPTQSEGVDGLQSASFGDFSVDVDTLVDMIGS